MVVISAIGSMYLIKHPEILNPNNPKNKEHFNKIKSGELQDPRSAAASNLNVMGWTTDKD